VFDVEHVRVTIAVSFCARRHLRSLSLDYSSDCILFWAI
jgi:hypothetical protein